MTPEQEAALRHARMTPQELREEEGVRDWAALYDHDMTVEAPTFLAGWHRHGAVASVMQESHQPKRR